MGLNQNTRRKTHQVSIGTINLGSDQPIVIQSMTNTETSDIKATVSQIKELYEAGSEIVRVTVDTFEAVAAIPMIVEKLAQLNIEVPIVGDFHFNGHRLLERHPECAEHLSKLRINPGNVGKGSKKDEQFSAILEMAIKYKKPIRIGVNGGSLDQKILAKLMDENNQRQMPLPNNEIMAEAMITSALESAKFAESIGVRHDQIILSVKVSLCQELITIYQRLAERCQYPLHLGLTEAGMGIKGIVSSTAALSVLLQQGIGDTIRVSLTPKPSGSRTEEVMVAKEIVQSLGFRLFSPKVVSCPGCGRTSSTYFQQLALQIQEYINQRLPQWKREFDGVETMSIAVMGCVVNGPGESKMANIGISLPGNGEHPVAPVYEDGQKTVTLKGENIANEFQILVESYVKRHYSPKNTK